MGHLGCPAKLQVGLLDKSFSSFALRKPLRRKEETQRYIALTRWEPAVSSLCAYSSLPILMKFGQNRDKRFTHILWSKEEAPCASIPWGGCYRDSLSLFPSLLLSPGLMNSSTAGKSWAVSTAHCDAGGETEELEPAM